MNKLIGYTAALSILLLSGSASAATFYLDGTNGNNGNTGSSSAPWLTFAFATGQLNAGDTLIVRAGTYNEVVTLSSSGTAQNRITVRADSGAQVIVDGNNTIPASQFSALVRISGSYITWDGITVRNSRGVGIEAGPGNGIVVQNCTINGNFSYSILYEQVSGGTITSNTIFDNVTENRNLIALGSSNLFLSNSSNVAVEDNTIRQNFGSGLTFRGGSGNTARRNVIFDNVNANLSMSDTANIDLRRNFVYCTLAAAYSEGGTPPTGLQMTQVRATGGVNRVTNNIIANCEVNIDWTNAGGGDGLIGFTIANNTLVNAQSTGFFIDPGGAHSNTSVVNNLLARTTGSGALLTASGISAITWQSNAWDGPAPPAAAQSSGDVTQSCQLGSVGTFVASSFRIGASSPCRDAGTTIAAVTVDYFNTARPQGSSYDIGAHEVSGAPPPDSGPTPDSTVDSGPTPDSTVDSGPTPDSTVDSGPTPDSTVDSGPTPDSTADSGPAPDSAADSGPAPDSGADSSPASDAASSDGGSDGAPSDAAADTADAAPDAGAADGSGDRALGESTPTPDASTETSRRDGPAAADATTPGRDGGAGSGDGGSGDDDGGCSCHTGAAGAPPSGWLLGLAMLLLLRRRRRRRRRAR